VLRFDSNTFLTVHLSVEHNSIEKKTICSSLLFIGNRLSWNYFQGSSSTYHNPHLEDLLRVCKPNSCIDLSVRELIDQDMSIVVQRAIMDKRCTSLYLTGNKLSNQSLSILTDALYNNVNLVELDLSDNQISDYGVSILIDVLVRNRSILSKLHLGSNHITDQGVKYLSEMLKTNRSLTHLMLNRNQIGYRGVHVLSHVLALNNSSLEVLSLSSNSSINDTCVDLFIVMLKQNNTLKALDLKCCNLSQTSNQRLQQVINEKNVFELHTSTTDRICRLS
jgi:Ran GTPase-activating protein (RanGAP) involved in mRNA processing and transport